MNPWLIYLVWQAGVVAMDLICAFLCWCGCGCGGCGDAVGGRVRWDGEEGVNSEQDDSQGKTRFRKRLLTARPHTQAEGYREASGQA